AHLNTSKRLLGYYLKNKPADHIPFWDYQAPDLPNTYHDASAASITCAALIDLYNSTSDTAYLVYAEQIIDELTKPFYMNTNSTNAHLLLRHSTGGTNGYEADVAQTYSDYYFIEALVKYLQLNPDFEFPNLPPRLHKTNLPDAIENQPYSANLEAFDFEGGNLIFSSNNLPQGWSLTTDGELSATPSTVGNITLDVLVSDGKLATPAKVKLAVKTATTAISSSQNENIICNRCGNVLIITNRDSQILKIEIFTLTGIKLIENDLIQDTKTITLPEIFKHQFLIVKVSGEDKMLLRKLI
nr:hypothetical protein [Paludibacteraceae bacterium]